jgi:hypothetical protein
MDTPNDTNLYQPERFWCSLPSNDPRFADLRALLVTTKQDGRYSPVARMLGEYALLGYLISTGKLALGATTTGAAPAAAAPDDLDAVQAAQQHLDRALAGLDFE